MSCRRRVNATMLVALRDHQIRRGAQARYCLTLSHAHPGFVCWADLDSGVLVARIAREEYDRAVRTKPVVPEGIAPSPHQEAE